MSGNAKWWDWCATHTQSEELRVAASCQQYLSVLQTYALTTDIDIVDDRERPQTKPGVVNRVDVVTVADTETGRRAERTSVSARA